MEALGEPTLKPFLQDVIQLGPLVRTMGKQVGAGGPEAAGPAALLVHATLCHPRGCAGRVCWLPAICNLS